MPSTTSTFPTVGSRQCPELHAVQDAIDVLEETLPPSDKAPAEHDTISVWRNQVDTILTTELTPNTNPGQVLKDIHALGHDVFESAGKWPRDPAAHNLGPARFDLTQKVGKNLAAYDAKAFMRAQEHAISLTGSSDKMPGAVLRQHTFCAQTEPHKRRDQEFLGLLKHELADITSGGIERPGSRDMFDPALVDIKYNWSSTTQLTTEIAYDGDTFADFGETADLNVLGEYRPRSSQTETIANARRMFYEGHPFESSIPPKVEMGYKQMWDQVKNDLDATDDLDLTSKQRDRVGDLRMEFEEGFDKPISYQAEPASPESPDSPGM